MHAVSALFPVARPREAAAALLAGPAATRSRVADTRSRVAEAVALAFAIRDAGESAFALHAAAAGFAPA